MSTRFFQSLALAVTLIAYASVTSAHEATGISGGFASGFMHPNRGWDA